MSKWLPPKIFVHRQPDGTVVVVDETGSLVATPPPVTYVPANGESKYLDPWGNEVATYQLPDFHVHRAPDGSVYAVDESGAKLTTQPVLQSLPGGEEGSLVAVLSDGSIYEPATYTFPEEFFVHTAVDGTMTAVDASGVPLPTQPQLAHGFEEEGAIAVLPDGSKYTPEAFEFPREFFVHSAADGTMTAVDASGVPLPTQPHLARWGAESEPVAVMPDGSKYEPSVYQFPRDFYVHTAADGTMTAVDASGTPLPTQPHLTHWGPEGEAVAAMPDGSAYSPKPLYPPSGEPPEEWPPEGETETTGDDAESESAIEGEGVAEEIAPTDEMATAGFSEELLTAGLVEPAAGESSTVSSAEAHPMSAEAGGGVGDLPIPVPQPESGAPEVPSEVALDGKGADAVMTPEMKWDEAQEQTFEVSRSAMDPDPVDMGPDPETLEEAATAIEDGAGRAATGVAAAANLGEMGVGPEMKLGETQEDAAAGKWAGVEPVSGESVEITIEEVLEIEEPAPIEEVAVEEVSIAEVEVGPVVGEETRTVDEVMPATEEEAPPLDE